MQIDNDAVIMTPTKATTSKPTSNSLKQHNTKHSSSYTPFARKYRPNDFSELQGQEVLVTTLNHCIEQERIAQAYLLTGIRGVGKTSTARIIAKTLNCEDKQSKSDQDSQKVIVPCHKCKNCDAVKSFSHPDVIEIDAASHTGVDDVRSVIESSEYMPLLGKYKIFIIDEVHMLSRSAFNALLKIVEEPPKHVVFIFATTEVQKIPLTIISRCQRFDLRRFSFNEIHSLLGGIAKNEKIDISKEALNIIAIKSEGSARDAIAILDQAASFALNDISGSSEKITEQSINNMLGLVQHGSLLRLVQYVVANDTENALGLLKQIYNTSSSLENYIASVADFIAEMTKEKLISGYHNPLNASFAKEIADLLIGINISRLSVLWQIFANGVNDIKHSHNELLSAEMTVIKAIHASNMPSMQQLLTADEQLNSGKPLSSTPLLNDSATDSNQNHKQHISDKITKAEAPATHVKVPATQIAEGITNNADIFQFLGYCHHNNEMDIYYLLLNDVEIKSFTNTYLELSGKLVGTTSDRIKKLLEAWSGQQYQLKHSKTAKGNSLKDQMLEEVRLSEDFNVIKNKFPGANISDIILAPRNT